MADQRVIAPCSRADASGLEIDVESLARSRTLFGPADEAFTGRHGHRVPWRQYLALFIWMCLLVAQYLLTRLVCQLGIPDDCVADTDAIEVMQDLQVMFTLGFVLAILTGVHLPERFAYLFCFHRPQPRGFFFLLLFLASGPCFGALGFVPVLQHLSLTSAFLKGGWFNILEIIILIFGAVFILLWHFWCAFKHNSLKGFFAYSLSRLAVWIYYFCYLAVAASTSGVRVHLHHYVVAYLCATLAEFNHPVSLALLAIATGIFVQGISAYEAAPVVQKRGLFVIF